MIRSEIQEAIEAIHSLDDPPLFTRRYFPELKYLRWYHRVDRHLEEHPFSMILVHPGSGKSTRISQIEAVKEIARDKLTRIGYLSKIQGRAALFMESAGNELRTNPRLIQDFGPFYDHRLGWSAHKIRILGSNLSHPTPTLINVGSESQVEMLRFKLLILDDPIDLNTALSPAETSKMAKLIGSLIDRLDSGGRLIIVGHRFLPNDNYQQIIEERPYIQPLVLEAVDEDERALVPELWGCYRHKDLFDNLRDMEQIWSVIESCPDCQRGERLLVEKKDKHSSWEWGAWYMQQRMSPEDATFGGIPKAYIKGDPPAGARLDATADPAYSTSENADYSVAMIGCPYEDGILLVDIKDWRINRGWASHFCEWASQGGARDLRVEINNAQTLGVSCRDYCRDEGLRLNVEDLRSKRDKAFRIGELAGRAEKGRIYFLAKLRKNPAFKRLLKEWDLYPNAGTDDHLDCLNMLWDKIMTRKPRPGIRGANI